MRKKRKKENSYSVLVLLFCAVALLLYFNFNIWQERVRKEEKLARIEERVADELQKRDYLQEKTEGGGATGEIERIAREQLLLQKEGEQVVVITRKEEKEEEAEEKEEKGFWEKLLDTVRW